MEKGEKLVMIIDGQEIASLDSIELEIPEGESSEWRQRLKYAEEWTFQGEIVNGEVFQYYYRRGDRLYFKNCFGDKIWVEPIDDGIHGELKFGELYKLLWGYD